MDKSDLIVNWLMPIATRRVHLSWMDMVTNFPFFLLSIGTIVWCIRSWSQFKLLALYDFFNDIEWFITAWTLLTIGVVVGHPLDIRSEPLSHFLRLGKIEILAHFLYPEGVRLFSECLGLIQTYLAVRVLFYDYDYRTMSWIRKENSRIVLAPVITGASILTVMVIVMVSYLTIKVSRQIVNRITRLNNWLRRVARPRLKAGYSRHEWVCTCGKPMFRDYTHRNTANTGSSMTTATSSEIETSNNSSALYNMPGPSSQVNRIISTRQAFNIGTHQRAMSTTRKFLELCVNTGPTTIYLGEIEVTQLTTDQDLFAQIAHKYHEIRGNDYRRMFRKPRGVEYVLFRLKRVDRVWVVDYPSALPPEEEIKQGRYAYYCPIPPGPPPMDNREFIHYLRDYKEPHGQRDCLDRLPKKLVSPLSDPNLRHYVHGWGIHIIEGPNKVLLSWICFCFVIISFIVSVIYACLAKTQEQGFGIGSWMISCLGTALAALYFQWEETC